MVKRVGVMQPDHVSQQLLGLGMRLRSDTPRRRRFSGVEAPGSGMAPRAFTFLGA